MPFKKIALSKITIIVFITILFAGCTLGQKDQAIDCIPLLQSFDDYVEKFNLPIIENQDSLCHGLYVSSDFSNLPPKWAIGKLVNIRKEFQYFLKFTGLNKTETIRIPLEKEELDQYQIGEYYKIDMNNICRSFFMLADSRYPFPIEATFAKPEKVICK